MVMTVDGSARGQCGERQTPMRGGASSAGISNACSTPSRTAPNSPISATERVKKPSVSMDSACALTPARLKVPNDGLNPTAPQYEAGRTIEPTVWVPSAIGTSGIGRGKAWCILLRCQVPNGNPGKQEEVCIDTKNTGSRQAALQYQR